MRVLCLVSGNSIGGMTIAFHVASVAKFLDAEQLLLGDLPSGTKHLTLPLVPITMERKLHYDVL